MDKILKTPVTCIKCGKQFDLMKFGYPGDITRNICWECKPPVYATASPNTPYMRTDNSYYETLDYAESRCLGDRWE